MILIKVYNFSATKSTEDVYLTAFKIDTNFEGKLACASKN